MTKLMVKYGRVHGRETFYELIWAWQGLGHQGQVLTQNNSLNLSGHVVDVAIIEIFLII